MAAVWLFPGQGSQRAGMASAWAERSAAARTTLDEAADVLGFDLPGLMASGPEDLLSDTYNQQPAILAASIAVLRAVRSTLPEPILVAGHSLGEYGALVAAAALEFPDALRLVRERGRLMRLAGQRQPGRMAAILGLDDATVEEICAGIAGVQVANYNAPGQVVISGQVEAVEQATRLLAAEGARKIVVLPISIAAHSHLMAAAAEEFADVVHATPLRMPRPPLVANISARPITAVDEVRQELAAQLTGSVRWTASVHAMHAAGATAFYELGPGKVLCGLVKRILVADRNHLVIRSLGEPEAEPGVPATAA